MTVTMLVPDWNATDELREVHEAREASRRDSGVPLSTMNQWFRNTDINWDSEIGDYFRILSRLGDVPKHLKDIRFPRVGLSRANSPLTQAIDGPYEDDCVTGRVESYVRDGVIQQSIVVWGSNLIMVNQFFDALVAGKKHDWNMNPAPLARETITIRDVLPDGKTRTVEVEFPVTSQALLGLARRLADPSDKRPVS